MADPHEDMQRSDEGLHTPEVLRSWRPGLYVGVVTAALGLVVALYPTSSLTVVSVLLGVLLLASGVLYVARAIGNDARRRGLSAIVGVAFLVLGVVLVRHVNVTIVMLALLVGLTWIVQGVVELMAAVDEHGRDRAWLAVFGSVSLAAGIVVVAVPIHSVTVLTVLLGIWWIVLGALEVAGALAQRRVARRPPPPGGRATNGSFHLVGWPGGADRHRRSSSSGTRH